MRTRIFMEEHYEYTGCQHSMTFVRMTLGRFLAVRNTHVTLLWSLVHEFHHQHSFPVPENKRHQFSARQKTFAYTFPASLVHVCASTALTAL
jgi:hypothetical protein